MKKILITIAVFSIIVLCSLLVEPLILQPTPQSTSQPTPSPTPTPQLTPTITPTPSVTPTPKPTQTATPLTTSTPQPTPQNPQQPSSRTLQSAIGNATNFLENASEPYVLLVLNVIYRRFGITEFADSLQRYDQVLAGNPQEAPLLRVFRRIADYDNPLQSSDLEAVSAETDRITVPALYCNQQSLSNNYFVMLNEAASSENYLLTHALLATIWIQENGYQVSMSGGFIESLYQANAALIGNDSVVTDLELEAATFLYLAGQGALVNDAFIQRVISAQTNDGGWLLSSDMPGDSNWHSSVLGLLLLLHMEFPADSYPPMLAPMSSHEVMSFNMANAGFPLTACVLLVSTSKKTISVET